MQIAPSPSLQHIVRHYLILSNDVRTNPDFRMFSDGSPGIVFHRKTPLLQKKDKDSNLITQPECFVYGQITQFNTLSAADEMDMLIIVLQPTALFKLFAIPAFELTNETIPFTDLPGQSGRVLIEQVQSTTGNNAAITLIEDFLLNRLLKYSYNDKIISMSLQQIYAQKGISNITEILKQVPTTERQLERKFHEHIGLSPKKFTDIIKFQHLLKNLKHISPTQSLSDISYISGYYDQPHLNNSFKKFTGLTPLQYLTNNNHLAVNFLALQ